MLAWHAVDTFRTSPSHQEALVDDKAIEMIMIGTLVVALVTIAVVALLP